MDKHETPLMLEHIWQWYREIKLLCSWLLKSVAPPCKASESASKSFSAAQGGKGAFHKAVQVLVTRD